MRVKTTGKSCDWLHLIGLKSMRYSRLKSAPAFVYQDERMESVMDKFESTQAWNLPVLDDENKYLGFVSKSKIFSSYRDQLKAVSNE